MLKNSWLHGTTNFALPPLPPGFMKSDGIFHLQVTLDSQIGEEVVLLIYDSTEFIHQLAAISPFNFHMAGLAVNTSCGPVFVFLFWVTDPADPRKVFAAFDKPVDVSNPITITPWAELGNQTHVHLFLVDADHEVRGFFEFENTYDFDEAVEAMSQLDARRILDFDKAQREYFDSYHLLNLIEFAGSGNGG